MFILALLLVAADSSEIVRNISVAPAETVQVTISGQGAPVVFVPGLFGAAYGFRRVLSPLVDSGYQAIVFEPLGVGHSGRPRDADYSLTAQAGRLAAVLDTLRVSRAVVAAHAMGASIAFRLALLRPDLVAGIVLLDGGPAERAGTPGLRRAMRWAPLLRLFGGRGAMRGKVRGFLRDASADDSWVTEEVVDGYTAGAAEDLGRTLHALERIAASEEPWELQPRLGEISAPVRLVIGTAPHKGGITDEEVELLHRALAHFTIDAISGAGHFAFEERPGAVVRAVQAVRRDVAAETDIAAVTPGATDR